MRIRRKTQRTGISWMRFSLSGTMQSWLIAIIALHSNPLCNLWGHSNTGLELHIAIYWNSNAFCSSPGHTAQGGIHVLPYNPKMIVISRLGGRGAAFAISKNLETTRKNSWLSFAPSCNAQVRGFLTQDETRLWASCGRRVSLRHRACPLLRAYRSVNPISVGTTMSCKALFVSSLLFFGQFLCFSLWHRTLTFLCVFVLGSICCASCEWTCAKPLLHDLYISILLFDFNFFGIQLRLSSFFVLLPASTYLFPIAFVLLDHFSLLRLSVLLHQAIIVFLSLCGLDCFSFSGLFRFVTGKHSLFFSLSLFWTVCLISRRHRVYIYFFVWCAFCAGVLFLLF